MRRPMERPPQRPATIQQLVRGALGAGTPPKGSIIRRAAGGGFRSLIAAGATAASITAADNATAAAAFTFNEAFVADKLNVMVNAAVALVAGNARGAAGAYVTVFTINGDSMISGNVPAVIFDVDSVISPMVGVTLVPGVSQVAVSVLNATGAAVEVGVAFTAL